MAGLRQIVKTDEHQRKDIPAAFAVRDAERKKNEIKEGPDP